MDKQAKMRMIIDFFKEKYSSDIKNHPNNIHTDPFRVLIFTILSQRTREENTWEAADSLFSVISSPKELLRLSDSKTENLIKKSGFYRQKAKTIKKVSNALIEKFGSEVPKTREGLMSLPGVGPKTADVVLAHSFGKDVIAVDVHVDVISKRIGLVSQKAGYEKTKKTLEHLTPKKDIRLVNLGFVFFGREICRTAHPKCPVCPLQKICEFFQNQ